MDGKSVSRDELALAYFDQLLYEPYPVQEEALLAWFDTKQGVLVCAPTGMGKTLIAEAALFEALHTGTVAYYTTPLIALTEQKFQEVQAAAVRWGFQPDDVGLVTGNRKVNPDAKVLVVVAEILLNRLLHREAHDFSNVSAVVMDEFHSFNDRSRGIVWELSLSLLPKHIRLLLLSATVGNTAEFRIWLQKSHGRLIDLVQSTERKVPLRFHWIEDQLLNEQIERMSTGDEETRRIPALVFCFNREECWSVAEQLKGKSLLGDGQQKQLAEELKRREWSQGIGPKLKTILLRGVGVHHAGLMPKYKRIVEDLFQRKLLSVCVCTETLSAGMNLPARSILMTSLIKGPPRKKTLIDPSAAHQMFGRAGRPQFDIEGYVFALAHEDDVKILRFKQKIDQIPEDTKDPLLIKKRKKMKKKAPTRRKTEQYWSEKQFEKLIAAPPGNLSSQGSFPWRLLAYLLSISPDVSLVRQTVTKRLMDDKAVATQQARLKEMLLQLEDSGYVTLHPKSPKRPDIGREPLLKQISRLAEEGVFGSAEKWDADYATPATGAASTDGEFTEEDFGAGVETSDSVDESGSSKPDKEASNAAPETTSEAAGEDATETAAVDSTEEATKPDPRDREPTRLTNSLKFLLEAQGVQVDAKSGKSAGAGPTLLTDHEEEDPFASYEPDRAYPNESLTSILSFKSINPLYAQFLVDVLPHVDGAERIQALESVLEFPGSVSRALRIPRPDMLPPSPFTLDFLNPELLQRGAASAPELGVSRSDDDDDEYRDPDEWVRPLNFPEKLLRLFRHEYPSVTEVWITDVWAAGELLHFCGDFNKLVTTRKIAKQEGILFRHILRFILLCDEFLPHVPTGTVWHDELLDISEQLTDACRQIDPHSTDMMIESARTGDALLEGEPESVVGST